MPRFTKEDYRLLCQRISESDEDAFRQVFHVQNKVLFAFLNRLLGSEETAKEIVQEVFLRLWMHRVNLPSIENPEGWLHTVAANLAYSHLRREARAASYKKAQLQAAEGSADQTFDFLEKKDLQQLIHEAVLQLPPSRQTIFRLSKWEQLSRKEIAEKLQLSENTVRNQLAMAMQQIQEYINRKLAIAIPVSLLLIICGH